MKVYYKIAAPDEVQAELTHLRTREQAAEGWRRWQRMRFSTL